MTGWALLVAATGIFIDAWAGWTAFPTWLASIITPAGPDKGSIGLIPAYLGFTTGMICFVFVVYRASGTWPGLLTGVGVVGMLIFWGSYPDYSTIGGLGSIVIGIAVLWIPGWARFASPLWVASGLMGITELVRPGVNWGPIAGFTLGGAAVAVTGAFVLWGLPSREATEPSPPPIVEPSKVGPHGPPRCCGHSGVDERIPVPTVGVSGRRRDDGWCRGLGLLDTSQLRAAEFMADLPSLQIATRVGVAGALGFVAGSLVAATLGLVVGEPPGINMVWALGVANIGAGLAAGWHLGRQLVVARTASKRPAKV